MIATKTKNTFVPLQQPLTRHTKKKANLKFNFIVSCRSTIFLEIISLESAFLFLLLELLSFCFAKKKRERRRWQWEKMLLLHNEDCCIFCNFIGLHAFCRNNNSISIPAAVRMAENLHFDWIFPFFCRFVWLWTLWISLSREMGFMWN